MSINNRGQLEPSTNGSTNSVCGAVESCERRRRTIEECCRWSIYQQMCVCGLIVLFIRQQQKHFIYVDPRVWEDGVQSIHYEPGRVIGHGECLFVIYTCIQLATYMAQHGAINRINIRSPLVLLVAKLWGN